MTAQFMALLPHSNRKTRDQPGPPGLLGPRLRGDDSRDHLPHTSSANSTIIRNLAHCSSSASTLPSSVEAKLSCPRKRASSNRKPRDHSGPPGLLGPRLRGDDSRDHLPHTSSANSTIIRSFAHCSSSASTLPSSVEAKLHAR